MSQVERNTKRFVRTGGRDLRWKNQMGWKSTRARSEKAAEFRLTPDIVMVRESPYLPPDHTADGALRRWVFRSRSFFFLETRVGVADGTSSACVWTCRYSF